MVSFSRRVSEVLGDLTDFSTVYLHKESQLSLRPLGGDGTYVCFQRSGLSDLVFPCPQEKDAANCYGRAAAKSAPGAVQHGDLRTNWNGTAFPTAVFKYKVTTVSTEWHCVPEEINTIRVGANFAIKQRPEDPT